MILVDHEIRALQRDVGIVSPWSDELVQPASLDLRLGREFRVSRRHVAVTLDMGAMPDPDEYQERVVVTVGGFVIHPGDFVLACTWETIHVPVTHAMQLCGKSSIARMGVVPHVEAGWFDPGWQGVGTLEIANLGNRPVVLRPGLPFCQAKWFKLSSRPERGYGGRYQHDTTVSGSRYGLRADDPPDEPGPTGGVREPRRPRPQGPGGVTRASSASAQTWFSVRPIEISEE